MSAAPPSPSPQTLADWAAASPELLAITDDAGAVIWCNAAFEQRFGRGLPAPLLLAPPAHPGEHIAIGDGWFAVHVHAVAEGTAWQLADRSAQHEAERLKELLDIAQEFGRVGLWERDLATGQRQRLQGDQFVAAMGSYTAPLLRSLGIYLNIYPAKGYSATMALKRPNDASVVSLLDDTRKIAISRLGDTIRVAGTAEMAGYDTALDTPTARARCAALVRRYEELFPGVADTSQPNFWTGLRPSTPTNIPYIGRSRIGRLWLNAGHGTLGWTHGAGSGQALAELMSGKRPALNFGFCGDALPSRSAVPAMARGRHA